MNGSESLPADLAVETPRAYALISGKIVPRPKSIAPLATAAARAEPLFAAW